MIRTYQIADPRQPELHQSLTDKINNLTKPKGSLGRLEELALRIGLIQETLSPTLSQPHNIIFAADHGIVEEGVSKSPKEITWQQMSNFIHGGAGINFLCRQHGFEMVLVDSGIDYDLPPHPAIIDLKVNKGTRSYLHQDAMTEEEMKLCMERGGLVVDRLHARGCNVLAIGEMGIGNTSASSLWMSCLTNIPLVECVGAGSGLNTEEVRHKYNVLQQAQDNYNGTRTPENIMRRFGGYEMVMAVGAMLRAAELRMVILIDGFIMSNCLLMASNINPLVKEYAIFGHQGDEAGHKKLLDYMEARPLLHLDLRLGEGSGAVCAYPIIDSACRMINEMDNFAHASITKYF